MGSGSSKSIPNHIDDASINQRIIFLVHHINTQHRSSPIVRCLNITDISMSSIKFIEDYLCYPLLLYVLMMTSICIVKFDGHGANEVCFLPGTCLQSSLLNSMSCNACFTCSKLFIEVRSLFVFQPSSFFH